MKKINRDPKTSNDVGGLYVKQGRLMNERPDGMTGIQQAAKLRKMKNVNISARCQLVLLVSELKP